MSGIEQLEGCVATILAELRELRSEVSSFAKASEDTKDMTRPLTAAELCERLKIEAESEALELEYLRRRCVAWGLRPLKGGRGWNARYSRAEVLRAEEYAAGKIRGRKTTTKGRKAA